MTLNDLMYVVALLAIVAGIGIFVGAILGLMAAIGAGIAAFGGALFWSANAIGGET